MVGLRTTVQLAAPSLGRLEADAVRDAVRSGWVSGAGPLVGQFEMAFRRLLGARHACAVSSGTAALHLALVALGLEPGQEVVVPALTFVATANAVGYVGGRVVFADVEPDSWNVDPVEIERRITRRTRGIVPVHFCGLVADMTRISAIARSSSAFVLEDAAQAIGAKHRGRAAGTLGDAAAFSFFANKVITTGEGGMVTTRRSSVARRVRSLRSQAKVAGPRYVHTEIGFSYRMTSLQAALGLAQLRRYRQLIGRRRRIAALYRTALPGFGFTCQVVPPEDEHCHSFFGILARTNAGRQRALRHLARAGIETRPFFEPLPRLLPYRSARRFPVSEEIARRGIFIPCSASLAHAEVRRVISALADVGS